VNDETNGPEQLAEGDGSAANVESDPDCPQQAEQPAEPEPDPLEAAQAEVAKIRDQLLRTAADFDNFRKRSRREVTDAEQRGREDLLRELLPVFDNLERAASHAETASDVQSLADGIRMLMRQFHDAIGRLGIQRIDTEGAVFDPVVMEAIQQLETTDHPAGTVAAQVQAGYRIGERLIRPAMVVVSKGPPA
jgi:molecular chaperone GrpE